MYGVPSLLYPYTGVACHRCCAASCAINMNVCANIECFCDHCRWTRPSVRSNCQPSPRQWTLLQATFCSCFDPSAPQSTDHGIL